MSPFSPVSISPDPAALLITGARVYTADPYNPWAPAILTNGNRIIHAGDEATARRLAADLSGRQVEEIHLPGCLVVPGLNDSHIHTNWGGDALEMLDLTGVYTTDEVQAKLRQYASANPGKEWIECTSLGYEALGQLETPRLVLDAAVADRPVYIRAFDWHSAWTNTLALQMCGIERGADIPLPNEVVVDSAGLATGLLKERLATDLIVEHIPQPTPAQYDERLCQALRYLNSLGITSVQNMDGDPERLIQYDRLRERGDLTVRALHYMRVREDMPRDLLAEFADLTRQYTNPWNRTTGIKLFIDGVIESKTAMMLEPYADGSGERGVPDLDLHAYHSIVHQADALGMQVATHAIGDWGVRETLDAYQHAHETNGGNRVRRHRVEHIEVSTAADLARFARLGVTASMQPLHCAPTTDPETTIYTELLGPARMPYAFAWRTLLESGATLAFGSDWPIVTPDVRQGLHVALTRTTVEGLPAGGYQPQQQVTLAQALDAYTRGAAYAEFQEHEKGMLRPGYLADISVFAHDLFSQTSAAILATEIALTIVDGRIVYRRSRLA